MMCIGAEFESEKILFKVIAKISNANYKFFKCDYCNFTFPSLLLVQKVFQNLDIRELGHP